MTNYPMHYCPNCGSEMVESDREHRGYLRGLRGAHFIAAQAAARFQSPEAHEVMEVVLAALERAAGEGKPNAG